MTTSETLLAAKTAIQEWQASRLAEIDAQVAFWRAVKTPVQRVSERTTQAVSTAAKAYLSERGIT